MSITTIQTVDHRVESIAHEIWHVQQAAYQVEARLIEYSNFPPLWETTAEIQACNETFVACLASHDAHKILGVTSYEPIADGIDICRMVVDPNHFRRGIATRLLQAVAAQVGRGQRITVSTAQKNQPAVTLYQRNGYTLHHQTTLPEGLVIAHFEKIYQFCSRSTEKLVRCSAIFDR